MCAVGRRQRQTAGRVAPPQRARSVLTDQHCSLGEGQAVLQANPSPPQAALSARDTPGQRRSSPRAEGGGTARGGPISLLGKGRTVIPCRVGSAAPTVSAWVVFVQRQGGPPVDRAQQSPPVGLTFSPADTRTRQHAPRGREEPHAPHRAALGAPARSPTARGATGQDGRPVLEGNDRRQRPSSGQPSPAQLWGLVTALRP